MLQRMMLFSINTGMWTALLATSIVIVFFRTITTDFMVFGYFHLLSPLYFTTVLANLNARRYLNGTGEISLMTLDTNMTSEMQFAPVEEVFDRLSYREMSSLQPPPSRWRLGSSNASSEALNPHFIRSPSEIDLPIEDGEYAFVAI
ncbi:hypothetical protein CVT25_004064 [Psilocybe cyanescens]|uniref:DUF6534 domain-containing protein n=1 Tax=Psilocybe cyanescens TaxID=93625 RepID=A0A409XQ30_PSICY|nr:hypothetical protein CVT25_004064 [Psilocybe cyanescens]